MTTLCRGVVNDLAWFAGTIRFFLLGKTRSWSLEHDRRTPRRRSSKWGVFNECKQARKKRGKKKAILYEYCAMSIKKDEILNLPGFANFERYLYLRRGNELHSRVWFRTPFLTELLNMVWHSGGGGGGGAEEDVWATECWPASWWSRNLRTQIWTRHCKF